MIISLVLKRSSNSIRHLLRRTVKNILHKRKDIYYVAYSVTLCNIEVVRDLRQFHGDKRCPSTQLALPRKSPRSILLRLSWVLRPRRLLQKGRNPAHALLRYIRKSYYCRLLQRVSKENRRLYSAADPETLIEIEEKKIEKLKKTLPEFKALYNTSGKKPKITYYEGRSGIEQINDDTLRYKGESVAFTTPRFVSFPSRSTGKAYIEKRVAMGNHVRVIGEDAQRFANYRGKMKKN